MTLATRDEIAWMLADQGKPAEAVAGFQQFVGAELRVLGPLLGIRPEHLESA